MRRKRLATAAILFLAFFGIADSAYVLQTKLAGDALICGPEAFSGCNAVAGSSYSQLLGVPVSAYGVAFYALLFIVAALELVIFHHRARRLIQALAAVGFAFSAYFTVLQLFVINAFCIYCVASAVIALAIFLVAFLLEPLRPRRSPHAPVVPPRPPTHPYLSMPPSA